MNGCEFIRVVTKDDEECFLLTKLKAGGKEGFELTVFNDGTVWSGKVTEDELDDHASRLKINYDKYVEQTVEALTSLTDTNSQAFQYQLKRQKDKAEFSWKKHVAAENITFQLGTASLRERPDSVQFITQMFEHCVHGMKELKEKIHNLETDNERLSQERLNALKRLEKCVVAKEELEEELYSKFTMVLNSKKAKIRELKRRIDEGIDMERKDNDSDDAVPSTSATKRSRSPQNEEAAAKSDSDVGTDEETPKAKRTKASQRKKDVKNKGDDSLDLGNEEEAEEVTQVSRSRRQRGRQQKKQTPSKPVLPRVGSNESSLGSEKKSRLRKGESSNSNKSSENIDADELLGEL